MVGIIKMDMVLPWLLTIEDVKHSINLDIPYFECNNQQIICKPSISWISLQLTLSST